MPESVERPAPVIQKIDFFPCHQSISWPRKRQRKFDERGEKMKKEEKKRKSRKREREMDKMNGLEKKKKVMEKRNEKTSTKRNKKRIDEEAEEI